MTYQEFSDSLTEEQRKFLLEWIDTITKGLEKPAELENERFAENQ